MTVDVKSHSFFNTFAGIPEVLDKYLLIAGLLLFLCVSANSRREKRALFWTIILSSLVARLVLTPIVHLLYYQPHPFSLSQLRLLVSEKNDWPFPNGHAAFLFAISMAMYLYRGCINKLLHLLMFIAFYSISSSIARIPITSSQNMPIDDVVL